MISDILSHEICGGCGIVGSHPEAGFERIAVDELLTQDPRGVSYRLTRCWIQCRTCEHVWGIVTMADVIETNRLAAWLRKHPLRLLPKSAPR